MSESRRSQGLPMPRLGSVVVLLAAVGGLWLLYSEHRERAGPEIANSPQLRVIERAQSIETLVQSGPAAIPQIKSMLSSPDSTTRCTALDALWRLGQDAGDALEAVRARLTDEDPGVRENALATFSRICTDTDDLAAVACRSLEDADEKVRLSATSILESIGPQAARQVLEIARGEPPADGHLVIRLLSKMDPRCDNPDVVEALRRLTNHPDATARREAIQSVFSRGAARPDEVRTWLQDGDPKVVVLALGAIRRNNLDSNVDLLPRLLVLLENSDGELLHRAIGAVGALETAARPAIPLLMRHAENLDPWSRLTCAEALLDAGADKESVVRIVLPILTDRRNTSNRQGAGRLLVRADPEEARRQVSPIIREIEASETPNGSSLQALRGLAPEAQAAVPLLIRFMSQSDRHVRSSAVEVLGLIGGAAAPAVPILIQSLDRERTDSSMCAAIVKALGGIGSSDRAVVTALLSIINHTFHPTDRNGNPVDTSGLRAAALDALARLGDESADVVAAVRNELTANDSWVRAVAVRSLFALAPKSDATLPAMITMLDDDDQAVRLYAALATGHLAGDRRGAIARLTALLTDDNHYVCTAAALALGEIGPDARSAIPTLREIASDPRNSILNRIRRRGAILLPMQSAPHGAELYQLSVAAAARSALAAIDSQAADASHEPTHRSNHD